MAQPRGEELGAVFLLRDHADRGWLARRGANTRGSLDHVILRGIERRDLFRDDLIAFCSGGQRSSRRIGAARPASPDRDEPEVARAFRRESRRHIWSRSLVSPFRMFAGCFNGPGPINALIK